MSSNTKQFEKDYLRRSAGGAWEASKPFPPPGQFATEDHAQHILDFGVLLRTLAPTPSDVVLDLGAGSCWVSDWLRRCGVRTVAVDIAFDMLRLGQERLGGADGLVTGDIEHLPFADASFSKACCLNAFHHIPNAPRALAEIRRVLTGDGIAFFSEPGVGHATHPTSVAAAQNYGVLEQEVLIETFMDQCREAGFADVLLHPISHVLPLFVIDRDQWRDWRTYTRSTRPIRALGKVWRAALEVAGLRKGDLLFEEALAIRLGRELEPVIEQHPVITAHRAPFVRPAAAVDRAVLVLLSAPQHADANTAVALALRVSNTGSTVWDVSPASSDYVRVGVQLMGQEGQVIARDYARHDLPSRIPPGHQCELTLRLQAPAAPGAYRLKLDLVREGRSWFELTGSHAIVHQIDVR